MAENACCLQREIQKYLFAVIELNLFLDTHPNDCNAQAALAEACKKLECVKAKYNEICPLTPCAAIADGKWNWSGTPWPWEG